ncbi:MAG: hypothetical protein P1V97_23240 [Planctomycetota bacterium]|nr:hypothetical protein [Planctomycetota bacterium]
MAMALGLFFAVFLLTALLTAGMRWLAHKIDFVSRPTAGRWSKRVVPLGGGIPLSIALMIGVSLCGFQFAIGLAPAIFALFVLGLIDDLKSVPAAGKLIVQAIAASYVVTFGFVLPTPWPVLSIPLTLIWIVGVTNAVNLLDNMDGLSSGAAFVAALAYAALFFAVTGSYSSGILALTVAGASLGFLFHNFAPARIFMGDAGSLPLGFVLATLATRYQAIEALPWYASTLLAILPLSVPLFDTALVSYTRKRSHRPFLLGGRDHSSHRLVSWGLGERQAVLVLYAMGALAGLAAFLGQRGDLGTWMISLGSIAILFILLGVFLSDAAVDNSATVGADERGVLPGERDVILYGLEVIVDVAVIALVWTGSHYLRFQDETPTAFQDYLKLTVIPLLPFLLAVKLAVFFLCDLYRGVWRSISIEDVYDIFKAATLGTMIIVFGSALSDRLENLSRVVILIDWLLTFFSVLATRGAIRIFRSWSSKLATESRRAALLGPAVLFPLAVENAEKHGFELAGVFSEDTENKHCLGSPENLEALVAEHNIRVLLVVGEGPGAPLEKLAQKGVLIQRATLEFDL